MIRLTCPNCGKPIEADETRTSVFCTDCGCEIRLSPERASRSAPLPEAKKKKKVTLITILLWIFVFPIMATIFIWKSEFCQRFSTKIKAAATALLWIFVILFYGRNAISEAAKPKLLSFEQANVLFGSGLSPFVSPAGKAAVEIGNEQITVTVPVECRQNAEAYLAEQFSRHDRSISDYDFRNGTIYYAGNSLSTSYGSDSVAASNMIEQLFSLNPGDKATISFTESASDYDIERVRKAKNLTMDLELEYRGFGERENETVEIPWNLTVETPEPAAESEVSSAVSDTEKQLPSPSPSAEPSPTPEPTPEPAAAASGIRPDFKEMCDSYEAFIDEYCRFMTLYSNDPTNMQLLMEYTTYMSKLSDLERKMDAVDESSLTPEEDKYYLDMMLRCEKKLLDAAYTMN